MAKDTNETPGTVPTGKGRPTPKRKEREAQLRRPLVATGKEAKERRREENRARLAKEQEALQTGDERHMPRQHAGPVLRFARDFVDSRTTFSEFLLPAAVFAFVILFFFPAHPKAVTAAGTGLMLLMLAWIIESLFLIRKLRKQAIAKFGSSHVPRRYVLYAVSRMMQVRRLRLPKPQVGRGQYPA